MKTNEPPPRGCRRGIYGWEARCARAWQLWDNLVAARAAARGAGTSLAPVADAHAAYEQHFAEKGKSG